VPIGTVTVKTKAVEIAAVFGRFVPVSEAVAVTYASARARAAFERRLLL
jgi:hypothetical protein